MEQGRSGDAVKNQKKLERKLKEVVEQSELDKKHLIRLQELGTGIYLTPFWHVKKPRILLQKNAQKKARGVVRKFKLKDIVEYAYNSG